MKVKLLKKIRKKYTYRYIEGKGWYYDPKWIKYIVSYYPFSWDIIYHMAIDIVGEDKILQCRDKRVKRDI